MCVFPLRFYRSLSLTFWLFVKELQRKLRHVSSNLKAIDLPTNFKFFFLKTDRHGQEKAKSQIQKFLNVSLIFSFTP